MIRPVASNSGDREIEIAHELDGYLQGFGSRFWQHIAANHADFQTMLNGPGNTIASVIYRDRYLYSPLSVALLVELIKGLKGDTSSTAGSFDEIKVITTNPRTSEGYWSSNKVWSNLPNGETRDEVMKCMLQELGIGASIQIGDNSTTDHARVLEIEYQMVPRCRLGSIRVLDIGAVNVLPARNLIILTQISTPPSCRPAT